MAKKVQLQTNGKEWQVVDGEQVLVDVAKQDIDPITSSSCVQIEGFRTLEEAVSDNKMLSQDLTYTKVMDKVGGDYHQNVLDGQYSKAILYGNTQVNLCEEDTSVALQIPTTFTSFNDGELQINNKENQVVTPLLKGVTMVNLAQTNSSSITSGNGLPIHNVKGNTLYTLSFKFTTKNTNSGVVIQSYDANGAYIENTMHKTGLGDDVKFTFTTHANAAKVHICNNAAYGGETIQLDEIMLIEGDQTALDIPYFKGMKSVELSRPLTNLFSNDTSINTHNATVTNSNGTVTVTSTHSSAWSAGSILLNTSLKPNTKYLVMWDNLEYTQTSTMYLNEIIGVYITNGNTKISYINNDLLCPTKRSLIFDTKSYQLDRICLRIHATLNNTETGTTTVTGLRIFEYDDYLHSVDLQSIGWFSGTKNVAVEPVKTCSKNLYPYGDVNFTPTGASLWCDATGKSGMYDDIAQKSKCRFLLKKGTYCISHGETANVQPNTINLVSDKETFIAGCEGGNPTPFTLTEDTYCTLRVKTIEANVATTVTNIQIERGATATDYVAYDSRYYEPDGQNAIVLRSLPSGVCDTFNLQTGEYTRRIGEIVLNGSEDWTLNKTLGDGSFNQFTVGGVQAKKIIQQEVVCDRLISKSQEAVNNVIWIYDGTTIVIQSSCASVDELKTWLQQNPLTVQYEFRESSTTIIPRTIKRSNNGTVSTVDFGTYTNKENLRLPSNPTFLTINSMTSIKPVVEPITYIDFKTRLKTNTDYSIIMDKNSTDKTINLGGTSKTYADKMLVRTPSINLEQNLRISGSGSIQNIMVIEGDVLDKELPYFNGMCNVKMPIVKNCGKNLFDIQSIYQGLKNIAPNHVSLSNDNALRIKSTSLWHGKDLGKPIKFKKNTRYTLSFNAQDFNNIGGLLDTIICFVYTDGTMNYSYMWGDNVLISTAGKTVDYINFSFVYGDGRMAEFSNLMLVEGTETQPYEPYKENSIYAVQGEYPITSEMIEQGGFSVGGNATISYEESKTENTRRLRSKDLIPVKPNTTYAFKHSLTNFSYNVYQWDGNRHFINGVSKYFANGDLVTITTTANTQYIQFLMSKTNANNTIVITEYDWSQFHMYELDSTVQLRSLPNGVKDELNLLTGEYIQRVGEKIIDGYEPLRVIPQVETGVYRYINDFITSAASTIATIPQTVVDNYINPDYNGFYYLTGDGISFIRHDMTLDEFYEYLQQNPITVQYELAEPIISYPRIVSNTQEREIGVKLPNGVCDTYNPSTGITVKRVGKIVLDGSENWKIGTIKTNTQVFELEMSDITTETANNLVCDKLPISDGSLSDTEKVATSNIESSIYIALLKTKASTVDELKTYLASNPITVWYDLKNPIVTTDIVLPNGAHDEYNPLTGLYTKRVGYVELDGSDDEIWSPQVVAGNDTHCYASISIDGTISPEMKHMANKDEVYIMSNSYETVARSNYGYDKEQMYVWSVRTVYLNIIQSRLSTVDITGFRQYLSQNPIKLWYELQNPITYQLTPYFGLPIPYAYKDGYLIMDSAYDGQTLPPEITYQLTVNRTGQITQNNIKLKEHTDRLSNLEYILIEATLDSIFDREMQNFELELMNIELFNLDE